MTEPSDPSRFTWITRIAFGLLLAIVVARCLMLEVVRDSTSAAGTVGSGPGATTSLLLDWLTFVPMLLILVRRLVDADYALRCRWVHLAFGLLAAWTIASVSWSGDRFIALIGSMQILAGASLFWSVTQLVRRWEHLRIVVGICVGLLLANAVQALLYRTMDLPDLQNFWQENKDRIIAERGWKPGDFVAMRFEKKLMAGELMGFNASPNTLGAIVVMLAIITLGAAMQRVEDKDDQGWIGLMFIAAASAFYPLAFTSSKASWGALLVCITLLALWRLSHRWLAGHRGFVFAVAMGAIALAIVSVVALGMSRGGLPEDSINFRWRYWMAAWASFQQSPLHGVGWSNFAGAFLEHRLPVSAEEINDPHNFIVRWATELGAIGLVLGVLWLITWTWSATRPLAIATATTSPLRVKSVLWIGFAAFILSLLAVDWDRLDESGRFYAAILETMRRVLLVGMVTLGLGMVCLRGAEHRDVDSRPASWLTAALFVGIVAFLLQSSIDIAFFQPGPFMLCVLLLGTLLGLASVDRPRKPMAIPFVSLVFASIVLVVMLAAIVLPVWLAESNAKYARYLTLNQPERAIDLYKKAFKQSPVANADYLMSAAAIAQVRGSNRENEVRTLLDQAIAADPTSISALQARGRYLADHTSNDADIAQSLADIRGAVERNPNDLDLRLEYAALLERYGKPSLAAEQLNAMLQTNDAYDPAEPERLELRSPGQVERIRAKIASLQTSKK